MTFFYTQKTANVILVYQYIRRLVDKHMSRVISQLSCSHHRLTSVCDCVTPLGKPIEEGEPLDSWSDRKISRGRKND